MNIKALLLGTAACAVLTGSAWATDASSTTPPPSDPPKKHHHHMDDASTGSDRESMLERRLEKDEQEIQDLKAQQNQGSGEVTSTQFEALQNQVYETQAAVKAASTPKDKKLHFKGITFTLGGFLAMESVWRSNNLESDIGSPNFSKIPFAGPGAGNATAVGGAGPSGGVGNAVNIAHTREFRFSARQSRVSGLAEGDDGTIHLSGYGEFDFLGAAASANSNESNSYTPRVRNLYGTVDWTDIGVKFLFGQSWSLATLDGKGISERTEQAPPTIEAQYVDGFVWTRQPQLRLVKNFGDEVWLAVSAENPQTTLGGTLPTDCSVSAAAAGSTAKTEACSTGGNGVDIVSNSGNSFSGGGLNGAADAEFNPGIQLSLNHIPDLIGKIAWEPSFLNGQVHLEAMGMFRDFNDRTELTSLPSGFVHGTACPDAPASGLGANCVASPILASASNHDTSGGGGGVAGLIKLWPGVFDVQFDTLFGKGIGRYGSGGLPDATYNSNGTLAPINEDMEMVGGTLHATPDFDIYVFAGRENEDAKTFEFNGTHGGYGNINNSNAGCSTFTSTATCTGNVKTTENINVGLWDKLYNGDYGSMRFGVQYSYTYNTAFDGGGYTPHTSDNMIFTSFRYYPF